MKLNTLSAAVGLSFAFLAGAAQSAIILPAGVGVLEDDNIEYVLDANNQIKTTGTLAVGDTLVAVITFDKVQDGSNNLVQELGAPSTELTGYSMIQVKSISGNSIVFGADADFEAIYGTGALAVAYTQNAGDLYTSCASANVMDCITPATNGSHWATVGFGDADDFWIASGGLDINGDGIIDQSLTSATIQDVAAAEATTKFGTANYNLSFLVNNTGYLFNEQSSTVAGLRCSFGISPVGCDGKVDIIGSGDILGGQGLDSPWFARSDFDFQVNRVPEPATLGLLGMGLLGMGVALRRRKA